jgi:hypothetical protein
MAGKNRGNRRIEVGLRAVVSLFQDVLRAKQRVQLTGLIGAHIQIRTRFVEFEVATLRATEPPSI